ncbi:MAG TPA: hemolysin family protein [Pirellulales bacterium]
MGGSVLFGAAAAGEPTGWLLTGASLLAIPFFVALNGFFVAAEFALVSVRKTRVEEMVKNGVAGSKAVETAVDTLDSTIAATQLGITLASIALGWVGEPVLAHLFQPLFEMFLPASWAGHAAHSFAVAVAFFIITFMHVVFGELIPKTIALDTPDDTSLWVASPLLYFSRATRPVVQLMNGTGNYIIKALGREPASGESMVHSVEELALLIEDSEEAGVLSADQAEFVQKVFRLSDKKVVDCMVPREKMAALELHTEPDRVLEAVRLGAHTRMPVYEGSVNNIVGIVNTKDLIYVYSLRGVVILDDALYPPLFLSPNDNVATALQLFKRERRFLAVVRDEAKMTLGLITMEDVLEEIVGDIEDEHDRPVPKLKRRPTKRIPGDPRPPGEPPSVTVT